MVVVPGKSLGIVAIGESRKSLELKGFVIEESRADKRYLKRENLLALLEQDKVVQIWFEKIDLEELRLNGKHPPKKTDAASLAQFFAPCDQPTVGSGGKLIYCSNRGIELAYDHADKFLGLSVLSIK